MAQKAMKRPSETAYMRAMNETVTMEDFREICETAKVAAKNGDAQARLFLAAFLCGIPRGASPRLSLLDSIDEDNALMEALKEGKL